MHCDLTPCREYGTDQLEDASGETVVVGTHDAVQRLLARATGGTAATAFLSAGTSHSASPDAHTVKTVRLTPDHHLVVVSGDTPKAVLYAAYTFAEQLGARFMLYGDVLPAADAAFRLPMNLSLSLTPAFALRGLQPFHDFVAGMLPFNCRRNFALYRSPRPLRSVDIVVRP